MADKNKKIADTPLSKFSAIQPYFWLLLFPTSVAAGWKFFFCVFNNYLLTQFFHKWGIRKIPVVHVDHKLDKKIPFTPSKVEIYLSFVSLFLQPLSMLKKRFGLLKTIKTVTNEWFTMTTTIYSEAGRMYKHRLSTTERPVYKENFRFRVIHFWDPHLLCVPSLHIALVAIATVFFKKKFKEIGLSDQECFQRNTEIYNKSIAIAESVLYVKQHSVNCIASALYMITKLFPSLFTPNDAINYINDMFLTADTIPPEDCTAIREYISFMYERFLLEGYAADDWRTPVIRWIENYDSEKESE